VSLWEAFQRRAFRAFGRIPAAVRRSLVRLWAPSFTVGAICVVVDGGRLLLVRQSYRAHWSAPGGLLDRGEAPERAAVREVGEEVGLRVELTGPAVPMVWPSYRRVDLAFPGRLAAGATAGDAAPTSPEIEEARWFPLGELPRLQKGTTEALRLLGLADPEP
jgi:8-oxo-dGTP pyrophosphatase MutT (NUDIX family)